MNMARAFIAAAAFASCFAAQAAQPLLEFDDAAQEARYHALIEELRCMVCQNQNVADSSAPLAEDLRKRTYEMIRNGDTDRQIFRFMTDRYGDFVLYRPPFKASTAFLWLAPAIFLALAAWFCWFLSRRRVAAGQLTAEQRARARRMLDE